MSDAPPAPAWDPPQAPTKRRNARRPNFVLLVVLSIGASTLLRLERSLARDRYGPLLSVLIGFATLLLIVTVFRLVKLWRRSRGHDEDFSPAVIEAAVASSGLAAPAFAGDGTLAGAPLLVVVQRTKAVEAVGEYRAFDHRGALLATITQTGQSTLKKVARLLFWFDIFMTHHFEVRDPHGGLLGSYVRPRKVFRSKVHLFDAQGRAIGTVRQENIFFHIRFALEAPDGRVVGRMEAENWRAWDFDISDADGRPVGALVKTWEGWARTMLTTADRFVVRIDRPLAEPLRTLAVSGALAVDVALKQDNRGIGSGLGAG